MPARRLEITVSSETWDRLERARGHEPRASFVKRALESALGNVKGSATSGGTDQAVRARVDPATESSVSSRAPVEKESGVTEASSGEDARVSPARPSSAPSRPAFKCPTPACTFSAGSAAAVCGSHGRKVVPA